MADNLINNIHKNIVTPIVTGLSYIIGMSKPVSVLMDPAARVQSMYSSISDVLYGQSPHNSLGNKEKLTILNDLPSSSTTQQFKRQYTELDSFIMSFEKGSLKHLTLADDGEFKNSGTLVFPSTDKKYNAMMAEIGNGFKKAREEIIVLQESCYVLLKECALSKESVKLTPEKRREIKEFKGKLDHLLDTTLSKKTLSFFDRYHKTEVAVSA